MNDEDYKIDDKKLDVDPYALSNMRKVGTPQMRFGDVLRQINKGWYFESNFEKIFLVTLSGLGLLRILQWIF